MLLCGPLIFFLSVKKIHFCESKLERITIPTETFDERMHPVDSVTPNQLRHIPKYYNYLSAETQS